MTLLSVSGPSENDYKVASMLCVAVCCRMVQCAVDDAVRCSVVNVLQCDMTCVAV